MPPACSTRSKRQNFATGPGISTKPVLPRAEVRSSPTAVTGKVASISPRLAKPSCAVRVKSVQVYRANTK
jgi:hypothetical protein